MRLAIYVLASFFSLGIFSNTSFASSNNANKGKIVVDWAKLRRENPELYSEYKAMLESIEADYMKRRLGMSYAQLLSLVASEQGHTQFEIIKQLVAERTGAKGQRSKESQRWIDRQTEELSKEKLGTQMVHSSGIAASSISMTSVLVTKGSIEGSSLSAALTLNSSLGLWGLKDNNRIFADLFEDGDTEGSSSNQDASIGYGSLGLAMAGMLSSPLDTMDTMDAMGHTAGRSGILSARTLCVGGSFLASATFGLKTLSDKESSLKARESQELAYYPILLETEKARATLISMFPNLNNTQIAAKVEQIKKTKPGSEERWRAIFAHDPLLLNMVDASQVIGNYMKEVVHRQTTLQITFPGLRSSDELPNNDIEAYITTLREDLLTLSQAMRVDPTLYSSDQRYRAVVDYLNMSTYSTSVVEGFDKKTGPFLQILRY